MSMWGSERLLLRRLNISGVDFALSDKVEIAATVVGEVDGPVDRNLLLKLLSGVKN